MSEPVFPLFPKEEKKPTVEETVAEHEKRIEELENFVKLLKGVLNGNT